MVMEEVRRSKTAPSLTWVQILYFSHGLPSYIERSIFVILPLYIFTLNQKVKVRLKYTLCFYFVQHFCNHNYDPNVMSY